MSDYSEFFLNCNSNVVELELVEISHPNFTQDYRLVRNAIAGVTVTLEDLTQKAFEYYPLEIVRANSSDDLDQVFKVQLGDVGEVVPNELKAVFVADGFGTRPQFIYRTYRSDDLTKPLYGPLYFEITNLSTKQGCAFEAAAPRKNSSVTGEIYTVERFPMLAGFF
jgi:hypothetical protein